MNVQYQIGATHLGLLIRRAVKILPGKCLLLALMISVLFAESLHAKQYGLVVGIDKYLHGSEIEHSDNSKILNLQGAENDANLIAEVLRSRGVNLPKSRILLGANATREAFLTAWQDVLQESGAGDTIYLSFAGHGGQVLESKGPKDEQDGYDETLMFYDFDPSNPYKGSLLDDEVFTLLKNVDQGQSVVFVADSCHSGGLSRSFSLASNLKPRSRSSGQRWMANVSGDDIPDSIAEEGEDWDELSHVTYLFATQDESLLVDEVVSTEGKPHGALSLSFARGMAGQADRNGDGRILRQELQDYIVHQVATLSTQSQIPGFLPEGAESSVMYQAENAASPTPSQCSLESAAKPLLVRFEGGLSAPEGVSRYQSAESASLLIRRENDSIRSYFHSDMVTEWPLDLNCGSNCSGRKVRQWQQLIDKFHLVRTIDQCFDISQEPVSIIPDCTANGTWCNDVHSMKRNELLSFEFGASMQELGKYFLLFNLAGTGELQWLYPQPRESLRVDPPFSLSDIRVTGPVGRDDLVAGYCDRNPSDLLDAFVSSNSNLPLSSIEFVKRSREFTCQWGRYPLITVE